MGFLEKAVLFITVVTVAYIGTKIHKLYEIPPKPVYEEKWWGPGKPVQHDPVVIKPFQIKASEEVLQDLNYRLSHYRTLKSSLEGTQHQYGINSDLLKNIIHFWKTSYNWRERERFLNQYPQYTVNVQGLNIHYLHVKPKESQGLEIIPLLLLHGWPGSIREFYELIPHLTTPRDNSQFVFEVIAPSLPGYGFSDAAVRPGLDDKNAAVLFRNFMRRLGYEKFYLQGGDWGAIIVQNMATLYPENVLGVHSNACFLSTDLATIKLVIGEFFPSLVVKKEEEDKVYPLGKMAAYMAEETGYLHLQATKPDTIGAGLNDSPIGLAAYILEKFITWTNKDFRNIPDGKLNEKYTYTNLLDNVMIYWITESITTSMRLYSETFNKNFFTSAVYQVPVTVPSACARFKHELMYAPESILKIKYQNLVHLSDYENGGHFPALEVPEILANDIYVAVKKFKELQYFPRS